MDVTSLRLREASGQTRDLTKDMRFIAPDDGNTKDRTVMSVPLGRSVGANKSIEVEVEWTAKIPRPFARTGCDRRLLLHRAVVSQARRARGRRMEHTPVPPRDGILL